MINIKILVYICPGKGYHYIRRYEKERDTVWRIIFIRQMWK